MYDITSCMRTIERAKRALANPKLFARGFNRSIHRRFGHRSENPDGIDVFDEDWDMLVVLDACRYDMFKSVNGLEGKLTSKTSKGSSTVEWLKANFDNRDLTNTVYVTANPQLERNKNNWSISLHRVIDVWLEDGWDEETGTVLAETMTEAAIEAFDRYPNKRLVVHYMQPHYPFVRSDTKFDKEHLQSLDGQGTGPEDENVWNQKFKGELSFSRKKLWSIYVDNLSYALDHVETLLRAIPGKTVVTSDHGNYVGERASPVPIREYGHPRGLYDDEVIKVPWLECNHEIRREIQTGMIDEKENDIESGVVADRLRQLGYKE